jgi:hypothetical protein
LGSHGLLEEHHGTTFDSGSPIKSPGFGDPVSAHYPFRGYRYSGPDVRDMPPEEHAKHQQRWIDYMTGNRGWSHEDAEELRRR